MASHSITLRHLFFFVAFLIYILSQYNESRFCIRKIYVFEGKLKMKTFKKRMFSLYIYMCVYIFIATHPPPPSAFFFLNVQASIT